MRAQWRWYTRVTERALRVVGLNETEIDAWRQIMEISSPVETRGART